MAMSDVISNIKYGKSFDFDMSYSIFTASDMLEIIDRTINKKVLCFSQKDLKEFAKSGEIDAVFGTNGYKIKHNEEANILTFTFIEGGLE
jgi:hypothetical protein